MLKTTRSMKLQEVLKNKGRYILMSVSESLLMCATRMELTVKDVAFTQPGGSVVAASWKGKRKMFDLEKRLTLENGGILMREKGPDVFIDGDSKTGFIGSYTLNLWHPTRPATEETAKWMINNIKERLLFNNLNPRIKWLLYSPDRESSVEIEPAWLADLPRHTLEGVTPHATPPHKCPLTDNELERLKEAEQKRAALAQQIMDLEGVDGKETELRQLYDEQANSKPLFKLFAPAGSATWLVYGMEDDGDTLWVVADLGLGCVEYGTASLRHDICCSKHRMAVEKERHFEGCDYTIAELTDMSYFPLGFRKSKPKAAAVEVVHV